MGDIEDLRQESAKQLCCWPAPAKLNLFLHIIGRRQDGYHVLQTVFQFLDYCDELTFSVRDDDRVCLTGNEHNVAPEQDLIVKAAKMLRQKSSHRLGVDISICKRIPAGRGLGGGSSNAATTLLALNSLWGPGLSSYKLTDIGLGLGADVPIFIHGYAAWAEGVGEKLTSVEPPEDWFIVVSPGVSVNTKEIFNAADLTRNTPAITMRDFLAGAGSNDCESVVQTAYPEIAKLLNWLRKRGKARMTGTGSCVFAAFATKREADSVLEELPENWDGFVTRGMNRSPLRARMEQQLKETNV